MLKYLVFFFFPSGTTPNFLTPTTVVEDTSIFSQQRDSGNFDEADNHSLSGRLSPDRRSQSGSVSSESKRKGLAALKFRKKSSESRRSMSPSVDDTISHGGTGDEDLDALFKKYENKKEPKEEKKEEDTSKEFNGELTKKYDFSVIGLTIKL